MNKILFAARQVIGIIVLLCLQLNTISAEKTDKFAFEEATAAVISKRVSNISTEVDMRLTAESRRMISHYTKRYRKGSEEILGKVSVYFPLFEKVIREKGLPDELKYLSVIESNLKPTAKSKQGATGLWQFMKSTGKIFGLEATSVIDERKDPEKSTYAAMSYLEDLYGQFGDWTLALAAYNCGPGNVRKAIRRSGGNDYWSIREFLPKETRDYIPRFVATVYLMNYYHAHGLSPKSIDNDLKFTVKTPVFNKLNLKELAKEINIDSDLLYALNPLYLKRYIPKNNGKYYLTLPETKLSEYLLIRSSEEVLAVELMNKRNFPAKTYLSELNSGVHGKKVLTITKNIKKEALLPVSTDILPTRLINNSINEVKFDSHSKYEYYKLGVGETIIDVANFRKDVTLEEILNINYFVDNKLPISGDVFRVREL